MIINDFIELVNGHISLFAKGHSEVLICRECGQQYVSRGSKDTGVCRECLAKQNFIGGPLDNRGEKR